MPCSASLRPQNAVSLSAWVYPTPPHQQGYGGIINNIAGHANSRLLVMNSGATLAQVLIGGSRQDVSGPGLKNNAWNHIVYVYDSSGEYWVVNGVQGKKIPKTGALCTESNPLFLAQCKPTINRPFDLLAHPDERTVVLAGGPGYGYTGGGLMFWDRETHTHTVVEHTDIIQWHSTMSLVALPDGKLLGGTSTVPGTGGEKKAKEAQLYVMDMATKKIEWHEVVFPKVQGYTDMCLNPDGLVYGIADRRRFFVFDPAQRKVIHQQDTTASFGPCTYQQGPRVFVLAPDDTIYMLFVKGVARVAPRTFQITMLAESPIPIGPGGAFLDGRIYFGHDSHVYSYAVPGWRGKVKQSRSTKAAKKASHKQVQTERSRASNESVTAYDAKLIKRVTNEHRAGNKVEFYMDVAESNVLVTSIDGQGNLSVAVPNEDTALELQWQRLTLKERKHLALAVLRENEAADHALAAFYLLATGDTQGASKHLLKAGDEATAVEACFE